MINKKYLKLQRSYKRFNENNFIYNLIAERIADSIDLLKINISKALEIGINDNLILKFIENKYNEIKVDRSDICSTKSIIKDSSNFLKIDLDKISFKEKNYDLIYSNYFLHVIEDFDKTLYELNKSLKSGGFFIAAIPHKEDIIEVAKSMYKTDLYFYNGVYQRINPTIEINDILKLFKKTNFESPSIYTDTITINYSKFKKLLFEVKNMHLTYFYYDKRKNFENKRYFRKLEEYYAKNNFDEEYQLKIKVNIISGWKI